MAEDIYKGLLINNHNNPEDFFKKFSKMQGILLLDEF
jgi:hypothetical protein